LGGRRNRDMVRLTVCLPRPVVAWLDGRAARSGLTRSDELRLALASLADSADGHGGAVGAAVGGVSSSARGLDAPGAAAGSADAVPAAVRTESQASSGPAAVREFSQAPGRPEVCGRCGMSKYRHASGRWCA